MLAKSVKTYQIHIANPGAWPKGDHYRAPGLFCRSGSDVESLLVTPLAHMVLAVCMVLWLSRWKIAADSQS